MITVVVRYYRNGVRHDSLCAMAYCTDRRSARYRTRMLTAQLAKKLRGKVWLCGSDGFVIEARGIVREVFAVDDDNRPIDLKEVC